MIPAASINTPTLAVLAGFLVAQACAQPNVLFDFDALPPYSGLPVTSTVGGITAHISATGQGFSIQPANVLGFIPAGFSGLCVYPSSIFAADLIVSFSTTLTSFSLLYAPEEYACDSSATMRVTAQMNGTLVGAATTNAQAGTWPSEIIRFDFAQGFNRVLVHYDAPPVTGGDWGPIFMADNMTVTPERLPVVLGNAARLGDGGVFQFSFTNWPGSTFTVLAAASLAEPLANWTVLGVVTELSPGWYQFADLQATNAASRFYRVSSP